MKNKIKVEIQPTEPFEVVKLFEEFLCMYNDFRKTNGIKKKIKNVHEILTGMTDKHGRICRYIKHQERKDPKPDWPKGMIEAMTGYIVYLIMLLEYYKIDDIGEGMINELNEAIKQHRK